MFSHLIEDAKNYSIELALFVSVKETILLLEKPFFYSQNYYDLPKGMLKENESIPQALQRILMEETLLEVSEYLYFLGHKDQEKKRTLYFAVSIKDSGAIQAQKYHSYAFVDPKEAVGYPISEILREMIELYLKR